MNTLPHVTLPMPVILDKRCVTCETLKPLSEYYLADKQTGRYASECKACKKVRSAFYKASHPGYRAECSRRYRERYKERDAGKYQSPEAVAKRRQRYISEADKACDIARRWRKNNPDKKRAQKHRRRARLYQNGGSYTIAEWQTLKAAQHYRCLLCGLQEPAITLTVDHIVAVSKGGRNDITNIQALCRSCNNWKRTRTLDLRGA